MITCRIEAATKTLHTEAACIVPKRRSEIQTEPRVWPRGARECIVAGDELHGRLKTVCSSSASWRASSKQPPGFKEGWGEWSS